VTGTGRERQERSEPAAVFRLIALSATAGIGYFTAERNVRRFDLISEEESPAGTEDAANIPELDALRCEISFPTRALLLAYVTQEYLRAKKAEYFGAVFTRSWDSELFSDLLSFLDSPDLAELPLTRDFSRRLEMFCNSGACREGSAGGRRVFSG
jgi:hypothetical protein